MHKPLSLKVRQAFVHDQDTVNTESKSLGNKRSRLVNMLYGDKSLSRVKIKSV